MMNSVGIPNPIDHIWRKNYPTEYWDNRIRKLSPYNSADRLEAMLILFQLVDLYVHLLTAKIKNPEFQWWALKEELDPTYKIINTIRELEGELDEEKSPDLEGDEWLFLQTLIEHPERFEGISIPPQFEGLESRLAWLSAEFLGAPVILDEIGPEPIEDPEMYVDCSNAILNFWNQNRKILNEFKHGFRIIPFDWETLEEIEREGMTLDREGTSSIEDLKEEYGGEEEDWMIQFMRMVKTDPDDPYSVEISVFKTYLEECEAFSRLTLRLLENLLKGKKRWKIEELFKEITGYPDERTVLIIQQQFTIETGLTKAE